MELKLVRFTAVFTCVFSVFVCAVVWFLPGLEQRIEAFSASVIQSRLDREARYAMLEQMSALEIMDYNTQQVVKEVKEKKETGEEHEVKEEIDVIQDKKLRLELPKKTDGADVTITADYVHQEIRIAIPGADDKYLYDYQFIGKSDKIANLDYSSEGGSGTMVLTMNKVVEPESTYDDKYLYLDFIKPKDKYDRVVVVDAGHGGTEPGAVSGSIYEKNITLAIVQQVKALFDKEKGDKIGVYYTRLDDTNPSLSERAELANRSDADLFVSIHINSVKGHAEAEGIEVMYDELAEDTAFDTKDFARICLDETIKATGAKKRNIISGHKIYIIRNSKAPAALIETGFITNEGELARLLDTDYQKKAAQGIYNAVHKSLKKINKIKKGE